MSETDGFLSATMPRFEKAETALHNGDAAPRKAMWSRHDPVTLFGAAMSGSGWHQLEKVFDRLEASFSNCTSYQNEVVAAGASGDLAYTVAIEHTTASVKGAEPRPYKLRVTTVFRREDDEWKVVHRHADALETPASKELVEKLAQG